MRNASYFSVAIAVIIAGICGTALLALEISRETPAGSVNGKVILEEQDKGVIASVYLVPSEKISGEKRYFEAESNKDGEFRFSNVPVGSYTLQIYSEDYVSKPVEIAVEEGRTVKSTIVVRPQTEELELYAHQHVFTPDEDVQLTCRGTGKFERVDFRIYQVNMDAYVIKYECAIQKLLSSGDEYYYGYGVSPATIARLESGVDVSRVASFSENIFQRDPDGKFNQNITLPSLPPGLYLILASMEDTVRKLDYVLITDLGVVTKNAGRNVLAYAVDIKTGKPISNANIMFYSSGKLLQSSKSNEFGLASFKVPDYIENYSEIQMYAKNGQSSAFSSIWLSNYNEDNLYVYTYTDRPVYRPGHKVYFKSIVRKMGKNGYTVPVSLPVSIDVRDSSNTLIYRTKARTDAFGCYYGEFDINPEADTGSYVIESRLGDSTMPKVSYFEVASYKKPDIEVKVTFDEKRVIRGDTVRARINASYYYGSPVANAEIKYNISRSPYWFYLSSDEEDYYDFDNYGYGTSVKTGQVRTDSNGEAYIEFQADWPRPKENDSYDADQQFSVEAFVTDASGTWASGKGSIIATRGNFRLSVRPSAYLASPGQKVDVEVLAMDYDRKRIANQMITIAAIREEWDGNISRTRIVDEQAVTTNGQGVAAASFKFDVPGNIRIDARSVDGQGNEITGWEYVWVSDYAADYGQGYRYSDIQIITDKKSYRPGDTASVLINTAYPGTFALVTIEGEQIYYKKVMYLENRSTKIELPITDECRPNAYICVCFVREKDFVSTEARVTVSIEDRILNVSVKPDKETYKPGDTATYFLKATDQNGKPQVAALSIGVVDEAIYAVGYDYTESILDFFYAKKYNSVSTSFSFPQIYLDDDDKSSRAASVMARKDEFNIRKRFKDTAYWNAQVITDSNGEAKVSFKMPDNLTSWRATVRGITKDSLCGEARVNSRCRQDLMVRLQTPRFMVQNDKCIISAMVHNYTGKAQDVRVSIDAQGLDLAGEKSSIISVPNEGSGSIDYNVAASRIGSAVITVYAASGKAKDAVQLVVPVHPNGIKRKTARSGRLSDSDEQIAINSNKRAIKETRKLTIRLSSSLAGQLLGSLDYLAQYPYGCTEQITSAFLPDVILSRALKDLGIRNKRLEKELPKMVAKGLFKLYKLQLDDGGWGWCEYGKSDVWMTAYVLNALIEARNAGFNVNKDVLRFGLDALTEQINTKKIEKSDLAYGCYVLSLAKRNSESEYEFKRIEKAQNLDSRTLAIAALASERMGNRNAARDYIDRLFNKAKISGDVIYWQNPDEWRSSSVETTALALQAIVRITPNDSRAPKIVKWLMDRRKDNYWYSTRDTAMVLYAMCEYLKASNEMNPDFAVSVRVNGRQIGELKFGRESLGEPEKAVSVPAKLLKKGRNTIQLSKKGSGNLYYNAVLEEYVSPDSWNAMPKDGLKIERSYYQIPADYTGSIKYNKLSEPITSCKRGDVLLVRLKVYARNPLERALVEDFIPAGFEIIDRGDLDYWDWRYWWVDRDTRDDRVSFYVENFARGESILEYQIRASIPGRYYALPAEVFAMYQPDIKATCGRTVFEVRQ